MKKLTSVLLCAVLVLSLCSVTAAASENAYMEANVDVSAEGVVTLTLKAARPVTNAKLHVAYDSNLLTCVDAQAAGTVSSVQYKENQVTIGLAWASKDAAAAGENLAVLTFAIQGSWSEEALTVTVENWNSEKGIGETVALGYRYDDVRPEQWFYDAVEYVSREGYFKGVSQRLFAPGQNMNRAMFVTVLGRMAGIAETTAQTRFTDVVVDSFYSGYVAWADEQGIVKGVSSTIFAPNRDVTREEMAVFLYRYAAAQGMDVTVENAEGVLSGFADADKVSSWAYDAMVWAVSRGLIIGTDNGLEPQATANRAQVAVIIHRFDGLEQ